jgi:hypothetical protein
LSRASSVSRVPGLVKPSGEDFGKKFQPVQARTGFGCQPRRTSDGIATTAHQITISIADVFRISVADVICLTPSDVPALGPIAFLAQQLDVPSSVAAALGEGNDVIDFKSFTASAASTTPLIPLPDKLAYLVRDALPRRPIQQLEILECSHLAPQFLECALCGEDSVLYADDRFLWTMSS